MKTILIVSEHSHRSHFWSMHFPNNKFVWGDWRFVFNDDTQDYDYLVVYGNLPKPITLRCPPQNTIHFATEPKTVYQYTRSFLQQFAMTVTQDQHVKHPGKVFNHAALSWHLYNAQTNKNRSFEQIQSLFGKPKTKLISMILSNKTMTDMHKKRLAFANQLKQRFGDQLHHYGRGFNEIEDKLDGLIDYRFSIVLENSSIDHYFTEKISDCFLAGTYPIYFGAPNLSSYFPQSSFCQIDCHDIEGAVRIINQAIKENVDQKYYSDLRKARDLVLYEYNLAPAIIKVIKSTTKIKTSTPTTIQPYRMRFALIKHEFFSLARKINCFLGK